MKKRISTHRSAAFQPGKPKPPPRDPTQPQRTPVEASTFELLPDLPLETPCSEPRRDTELELKTVRIGYFDPDAVEVYVAGTFNNWETNTLAMERDPTGNWSLELSLPPGEYCYRLVVDREWRDHTGAARLRPNLHAGNDAVITV